MQFTADPGNNVGRFANFPGGGDTRWKVYRAMVRRDDRSLHYMMQSPGGEYRVVRSTKLGNLY